MSAAMRALKANEAVLTAKLAEFRRYQQTDEYRAERAEKERRREENWQAWLGFAACGWPVSESLVEALGRK